MRLIDADNLQFGWCGSELCADPCDNCNKRTISKEDVDNAPTVEQECYITGAQWNEFMKEHKRPHGKWKKTGEEYYNWSNHVVIKCSLCGYVKDIPDLTMAPHFCEKCGADMRGGREDENT